MILRKHYSLVLILVIMMILLGGCGESEGLIVRYDINGKETECLFKDMSKTEVMNKFGLPHRSYSMIFDTIEYNTEDLVLRFEFENDRLKTATLYEEEVTKIELPDKATCEIDDKKYRRTRDYSVSVNDLGFISDTTNAVDLQDTIGPPYEFENFKLSSDIIINAFLYKLTDGEKLYILYTYHGTVGGAWIADKDGSLIEEIVRTKE